MCVSVTITYILKYGYYKLNIYIFINYSIYLINILYNVNQKKRKKNSLPFLKTSVLRGLNYWWSYRIT